MNAQRRKILLIEPPFGRLFKDTYSLDRYPLGLAYLAGVIQQNTDWEVEAYNADFTPHSEMIKVSYLTGEGFLNYRRNLQEPFSPAWEEIQTALEEFRPDVVAISTKTQTYASARVVAHLTKQIDSDIRVLVGGPHPSIAGSDALDCPDFDVAILGEGEQTVVEVLNALDAGRKLNEIDGVAYREARKVVLTSPRKLIQDLDSLPFPHAAAPETLKNYDKYPLTAFKNVFAVRGCPYDCFFCGSRRIWSRTVRYRSVENVVAELRALQAKGLRFVHFDDDTFGVKPSYIKELCEAITKSCPKLNWSCEMHVRLVNEQTISIMKRAGCFMIQIGIESGSNEILQAMRKGFTIEEAFEACRIIRRHHIRLQTFFMVGFPQETESTLSATVSAMKRIASNRVMYSIFTPYPGTEAYDLCLENDLIAEGTNPSLYFHQNPENCFCLHISPERFRELLTDVERTVDRRNALQRAKEIFSLHTVRRIGELGFRQGLRKGWNVLRGK